MTTETFFSIQSYGVLGYSLAMSLALAGASVGFAYWRAGRDRMEAFMFTLSAFLFAVLFFYLVLVSLEPAWLNRTVMQPAMRTVTLAAAATGWVYLSLLLRKEAKRNPTRRRAPSGGMVRPEER